MFSCYLFICSLFSSRKWYSIDWSLKKQYYSFTQWFWFVPCTHCNEESWQINRVRSSWTVWMFWLYLWIFSMYICSVMHNIKVNRNLIRRPSLDEDDLVYINGEIAYERFTSGSERVSTPHIFANKVYRLENNSDPTDLELLHKGIKYSSTSEKSIYSFHLPFCKIFLTKISNLICRWCKWSEAAWSNWHRYFWRICDHLFICHKQQCRVSENSFSQTHLHKHWMLILPFPLLSSIES